MGYWVKINYERGIYLIDLESISAFSSEIDNKRITFWLPNSSQPIILIPQNNLDAYKQVLEYVKKTTEKSSKGWWVSINYDRKEFFIDLTRITTFVWEPNGRLSFWLPDSSTNLVINPQTSGEAYQKINDFIQKTTGHSMP
ncbi:hypothetical protein [Kamptonema sp. UHCC 0994]|uniref:hypothetical protein n=1 Tax=Kamptonema sp. UHCC 0994 TaxID=3031329 RepID=UPI0023BA323A|nr:hypothetical protein [Kamptonema sp. UHCC 0994]MDF0553012.1 hypothetical protein [Kamptonema sp. UHCC 0994]